MAIGYQPSLAVGELQRGRRAVVVGPLAVEHERPVGRQHQLGQRAGEAAARLDQGDERAGRQVEALAACGPSRGGPPAPASRRRARCSSAASTAAGSPLVRRTHVPSSGSLKRRWSRASSSWRHAARSQPSTASSPARRAGDGDLGHAERRGRADVDVLVAAAVVVGRRRRAAPSAMPGSRRRAGRIARRGPRPAPRTSSAKRLRGATASTRPHATACWPFTPSARVEKTSARSRRTWRLSTTRVRPPVPGSTASNGTSGSDTADDRSSTSTISSHASASS